MKHNKRWFYNRIGKKVYCNDHVNGFWGCEGFCPKDKGEADNIKENQKRGIEFSDIVY